MEEHERPRRAGKPLVFLGRAGYKTQSSILCLNSSANPITFGKKKKTPGSVECLGFSFKRSTRTLGHQRVCGRGSIRSSGR